jgi:hypothetical protein
MAKKPQEYRSVARNKKAYHSFEVLEELECGLSLKGTEVKSLRAGHCSLQEAYARVIEGEAYLVGGHDSRIQPRQRVQSRPYPGAQIAHAPQRTGSLAQEGQRARRDLDPPGGLLSGQPGEVQDRALSREAAL